MFDASWIDHDRETIGQRRSRKETVNGTKKTTNAHGHSRRSSLLSSTSTEGQTKPTLLNFFGGSSSSTKKGLHRSKSQARLTSPTEKNSTEASRWVHNHYNAPPLESTSQELSGFVSELPQPATSSAFFSGPYLSDAELSSASDICDSVFSGWTGGSANTQSSWSTAADSIKSPGRIVQPLSPTSFISQNTEITVSPREHIKSEEENATVVYITAAGAPVPDCLDPLPESISPSYPNPLLSSIHGENKSTVMVKKEVFRSGWPFTTRPGVRNPDIWKPPENWDCIPDEDVKQNMNLTLRITGDTSSVKQVRPSSPSLELTQLQRNIRRMEAASPKIVLERLKEEWNEIADASVYKESELEKQLWMLTALRSLKKRASNESIASTSPTGMTKVLSLYENQASASSLSALTSAPTEIHHLSTTPLSPSLYPNIYPLSVPGPTSQLPYASQNFNSIHAFSLPSLLPASSIPSILKECHRTLTSINPTSPVSTSFSSTSPPRSISSGTLHLTILDPSPLPATLGPLLREWLDNHLLLHLEKQFRCLNPSRLFPIWLADAGLRAEGSTIVHVRFLAAVGAEEVATDRTKLELKSVVGRMLWKEMWGGFVKGEKWWWENEEVVKECERLGTSWEYAVVEAVKEG